jgi:phosphoinositide-3-kinase, regulatory subunit 4
VQIWELRGSDQNVFPRSALTYSDQGGRIVDLTMCENSHSVASASTNGTLHVWRVEVSLGGEGEIDVWGGR